MYIVLILRAYFADMTCVATYYSRFTSVKVFNAGLVMEYSYIILFTSVLPLLHGTYLPVTTQICPNKLAVTAVTVFGSSAISSCD